MIEKTDRVSWVVVAGGIFAGMVRAETREKALSLFLRNEGLDVEGLELDTVTPEEFYEKGFVVR